MEGKRDCYPLVLFYASVTLPNWTSHLTGSGPEQHGVTDNKWLLENHVLAPQETDDKGYYPSIFKVLKDQLPDVKTAFLYNWKNLIHPYNTDFIDDIFFEENNFYKESFNKTFDILVNNKDKPVFIFLYTVHTDAAGHKYGWMAPEYIQSLEEADFEIGELINKMKNEDIYKNTHILVTSDHGGSDHGHGGVLPVMMEVPWILTGPGILKDNEITEPNNTVNSAFVIAHLFNCNNIPLSWTGKLIQSLFEK